MDDNFWLRVAETIAARAAMVRKKDLEKLDLWRSVAIACAAISIALGVALWMNLQ